VRAESKNPNPRPVFAIPAAHRTRVAAFAGLVRTIAGAAATQPPPPAAGFSDEMGHRRPVDGPFLGWRNRATAAKPMPPVAPDAPLDVALWSHLAGATIDLDGALAAHRPKPGGFGALMDQSAVKAIEVWTEIELSSLHALWWIAVRDADARIAQRVVDAARWHIAHMQPDNATNHPWSAHVFAMVDAIDDSREAGLYAQALVHNCQMTLGRPDRLSAQVLIDCAEAVDAAIG